MRSAILSLLAILLLLVVLVVMGWFPQEPLRDFAQRQLATTLGPDSRIGRLHVVPRKLYAEVHDLVIDAPGYRLEAPAARVRLTLDLLLGRAMSLRLVQADSPTLVLRPAPATEPAREKQRVVIQELNITDATIVYRDPALEGDIVLRGIDASGSIGAGDLELSAEGGGWERRPQAIPFGPASARLTLTPDLVLTVRSLEAGTTASRVRASGRVGDVTAPDLDLDLEANADLADARYVPQAPPASGRIRLTGELTGPPEAIVFEGGAAGTDLAAAGWRVARLEAHVSHRMAERRSAFQADFALLGGRVRGEGSLAGSALEARASFSRLDTARIPPSALGGAPPLRGTLSGDLSANGAIDGALRVRASVNANGQDTSGITHAIRAAAQGSVRPQARTIDLAWRATADSRPVGTDVPVRAARLTATGSVRGPMPPAVEGRFEGQLLAEAPAGPVEVPAAGSLRYANGALSAVVDAQGLGGMAHAEVETRASVIRRLEVRADGVQLGAASPQARGVASLEVSASGPLDALTGTARVRVADLAWQGVVVGEVTAALEAQGGSGRLTMAVPAFNVSGDGRLRMDARPMLDATVRLAATPLAPLAPFVPQGRPLDGQVSGAFELAVPLDRPAAARVQGQVDSLQVASGTLSVRTLAPFTIAYENESVAIQGLRAEGAGATLEASGRMGLTDAAPVEARAVLRLDLAQTPAPPEWALTGRLDADVTVTGTARQPRVAGPTQVRDLVVTALGSPIPLLTASAAAIELAGDRIRLADVDLGLAGGSLSISGEVPLAAALPRARRDPARVAADEEARLAATWRDVQAGQLLEAVRPTRTGAFDTALSGELRLAGGLAALTEIRGTLRVPETTFEVEDQSLRVAPVAIELDRGRVETGRLAVTSEAGTFEARARVDLGTRALEGHGRGQLELRALSPFLQDVALTGGARIDVTLGGSLDAPRGQGAIVVDGASVRMREIPQPLTDITGRVALEGDTLRLEDVSGNLGGGVISVSGTGRMAGATVHDLDVTLTGRDIALRYPADFKSRIHADLSLTGEMGALLLSGEVRAERGLYDEDVHLEETFMGPEVPPREEPSPFLRTIALDLTAFTENPVIVRNNLADLQATGRLRIRGDAALPAPFGRLDILEGGKVFLQTREFTVLEGALVFTGSLDPEISLRAETLIAQIGSDDVLVTIAASGPLLSPDLDLSSDPVYSEREIASLIATGRRSLAMDSTAWVAGEQAAALLAGRLTRDVSAALTELGFDEVDIQPQLLAREEDPGARFTFGKYLSPRLRLLYSVGLNDPEARIFQALYTIRIGREVNLLVQREEEGTYTYGLGQRLRWGAPARKPRRQDDRRTVADVRVDGELPPDVPRDTLRTDPGDKVSYWTLQDDAERLQRRLLEAGHIEAIVTASWDDDVAVFKVRSGPDYEWRVDGLTTPPDLTKEIRDALYEEDALARGRERLLQEARSRGHLRASVDTEIVRAADRRTLVFRVELGPTVTVSEVRFPGAEALSPGRLLEAAGGAGALLTAPGPAREAILEAYRQAHYLAAEVDLPRVFESEDRVTVTLVVPVREGPPARIASVVFEDITVPEPELRKRAGIEAGTPYDAFALAAATQRIRAYYYELGYSTARVVPEVLAVGADLELVFDVSEGERHTIGPISVVGLRRTREALVRRQIELEPGQPLDPRKLVVAERRLLELGIFRRAVATAMPGEPAPIRIEVEEEGPYSVAYDVRFNRDERASATVDAEWANLLGRGIALGARYGRGTDIQETRASLFLPAIGRGGDFTGTVFRTQENFLRIREADLELIPGPAGPTTPGLFPLPLPPSGQDREVQQGFTLQQNRRLPKEWDVLLGYSFKRISSELVDFRQDISEVELSLIRDTRRDPLNAREGHFYSISVALGPEFLGSDFSFFRVYTQMVLARALGESLTWAHAYRVGLANGLDEQRFQQVEVFGRSTELFRAGGANSLRGFATDSVGPPGPLADVSVGGEVVVILNQELRYQHPSGLGAVAFYDGGNVFDRIEDVGFELRHSLGVGVRWESPVGLLRFDLGFPLNKRPTDRAYQWFFSLGQAF